MSTNDMSLAGNHIDMPLALSGLQMARFGNGALARSALAAFLNPRLQSYQQLLDCRLVRHGTTGVAQCIE